MTVHQDVIWAFVNLAKAIGIFVLVVILYEVFKGWK